MPVYLLRLAVSARLAAMHGKKSKTVSKELFSQGQSAFASKAASLGKEVLCQKLMSDFPMTVKR
jgi:hypothetical protein